MDDSRNNRETGARKPMAAKPRRGEVSQDAATNNKPRNGFGLTEPADDANEKTRHYDGQRTAGGDDK